MGVVFKTNTVKKKKIKVRDSKRTVNRLAILSTIAVCLIVIIASMGDFVNDFSNTFTNTAKLLNKLNDTFSITEITTNQITDEDFTNLQTKCAESGCDIFTNNAFSATKYNALSSLTSDLTLTANESARLANGILDISGNSLDISFYEAAITKDSITTSRFSLKIVASMRLNPLLSLDDEIREALKDLDITLPERFFITTDSEMSVTDQGLEILSSYSTINNLSQTDSKSIISIFDNEKTSNKVEDITPRLLLAFIEEFETKTNTNVNIINNGMIFKI